MKVYGFRRLDPPLMHGDASGSSLPRFELVVVFLMAVLEKESRQMTNECSNLFPVYFDKVMAFLPVVFKLVFLQNRSNSLVLVRCKFSR